MRGEEQSLEALDGDSASHGAPSASTAADCSPLQTSPAIPLSSPSPASPHTPSLAFLGPTAPLATSDLSSSAAVTSTFPEPAEVTSHSIYMLHVLQKKHLKLLQRWVQDGLLYLWADGFLLLSLVLFPLPPLLPSIFCHRKSPSRSPYV
ncbi:hypothetical protein CNBG_9488 [Cryptococcus deuterogattii R265]|uniref:uncharacterized protein n=1 Tax=Cryptococcus deuterogattii (strain R265) TaxID=294750 RepID=UPI0019359274|nr:hypothetical protein CNBG_9488 [Cryptococcus deuterogattii R265]